jgi:hypothetical protein
MVGTVRTLKKRGRARFLAALAESGNVRLSCQAARVGRSTVYAWRDADEKFRGEWDAALEEAVDVLEAEARRRGVEGVEEPVYYQGEKVGAVRRYSDTLLIFLLKGLRPQRYNIEAHQRAMELRAILDGMEQLKAQADEIEQARVPATGPDRTLSRRRK